MSKVITYWRRVRPFVIKILWLPVQISLVLFFNVIFAVEFLVIPFGGAVMVVLSGVIFAVFTLVITCVEFGIRITDALKSS